MELETEFKILMYCNEYVDVSMLQQGIYSTNKPNLYEKTTTIESLIESGKMMKLIGGETFLSDKYFENLQKCELVECTLKLK